MSKRIKTKYPGVYECKIVNRSGNSDVAYDIVFRHKGKLVWERAGHKSNGINAAYAARARAERLNRIESNEYISPGDMPTFGQAANKYFDIHLKGKPSEQNCRQLHKDYIEPHIGSLPLNKISPMHVEEIRASVKQQGLSAKTLKHVLELIGRVYRKAKAWGIYAGSIPTEGVEMPKVDAARLRFLTAEEAGKLLSELKKTSPQWHDISAVSLYTGMRLDEILSLQTGHVNMSAGIIHVMDAKAGTRPTYMNEEVKKLLTPRLKDRKNEDFVFEKREGGKITFISSAFKRAADKLFNDGVTDARHKVVFHTLRHTFASWLAQRGVTLYTIAELLGHSTLEMTKRYSKLSPDTKIDALKLLPTIVIPSGDDD
jgi:integrase